MVSLNLFMQVARYQYPERVILLQSFGDEAGAVKVEHAIIAVLKEMKTANGPRF